MPQPSGSSKTKRERDRESHVQRKEARAKAGLCGRCGKNPRPSNGVNCAACKAYIKAGAQKMVAKGLCPKCCRRVPTRGFQQCAACLTAQRLTDKNKTLRGACSKCGKPKTEATRYCHDCLRRDQARNRRLRDETFAQYGGYRCVCCGETEPQFLQLDHVNNDGGKHRRAAKIRAGQATYRWLKQNGYPRIIQVLCCNCHNAKSFYGDCPHKSKQREVADVQREHQTSDAISERARSASDGCKPGMVDQVGQTLAGSLSEVFLC